MRCATLGVALASLCQLVLVFNDGILRRVHTFQLCADDVLPKCATVQKATCCSLLACLHRRSSEPQCLDGFMLIVLRELQRLGPVPPQGQPRHPMSPLHVPRAEMGRSSSSVRCAFVYLLSERIEAHISVGVYDVSVGMYACVQMF